MSANPIPIAFPLGGIVENVPYAVEPGPIAVRADHLLNVRPYDGLQRRRRGGKRTGIKKYFADQVNGTNPIQAINSFVQAFDADDIVVDTIIDEDANGNTDTFTGRADQVSISQHNSNWSNFEGGAYFDAAADDDNGMAVFAAHGAAAEDNGTAGRCGAAYTPTTLGSAYILTMRLQTNSSFGSLGIVWRVSADPTDRNFYLLRVDTDSIIRYLRYSSGSATTLDTISLGTPITTSAEHTLEVRVNGDKVRFFLDSAQIGTEQTMSFFASNSRVGFISERGSSIPNDLHARSYVIARASSPATLRTSKIVAVSGGDFAVGTRADGLTTPTGGSGATKSAGAVDMQAAFQDVFMVDGLSANYNYYDAATNQVKDWATDLTAGSLPAGTSDTTLGCRIIVLYRGRIVMSGLEEEPQNWFMSKAGDPFDWDYSPSTTSAIQAVAGNNSDAGELGDVLTALVPFQDDLLFMAGGGSLWVMRGDPAAGGQIDNVSRQIGIVQQTAWTWDARNNLYFVGTNGLYRLAPNSASPELVSRGKMDRIFAEVNYGVQRVYLLYDREWQGVQVFIAPENEPSAKVDQYWYDERTDTFWRDQYPTGHGPTAVHLFDGDQEADRGVLLGGYDGYIRTFDEDTEDDDGSTIESFARFPLIHPRLVMGQFQVNDIQLNLDPNGAGVTFDIFRGNTPEEAANSSTSVFSRSLVAGRNVPMRKRVRANALSFRIRHNTAGETWAYEDGAAVIRGVGRVRTRVS